jgi:hypothetical protein
LDKAQASRDQKLEGITDPATLEAIKKDNKVKMDKLTEAWNQRIKYSVDVIQKKLEDYRASIQKLRDNRGRGGKPDQLRKTIAAINTFSKEVCESLGRRYVTKCKEALA